VPESALHAAIVDLLVALLRAWAARMGNAAFVARNLALRWDQQRPATGIDPDVCVIEPAPSEGEQLRSLRTWEPGHAAPRLAVEVVSPNHPYKDYDVVPDKYAASGVGELWVFDPELAGPKRRGGPHRLQLWSRSADTSFERRYAGDGPMFSPALNAWVFPADGGRRLRIADDSAGTSVWLSAEEIERAAKEAALNRVRELEAELARAVRKTGADST
jgi:hypothetical protein